MIYLDNCATTPVYPEVAAEIKRVLDEEFGNPSSLHALGRQAQDIMTSARASVARVIGAQPGEILFTSCASEGNNQVLKHFAGGHIITTEIEHPSVRNTLRAMAESGTRVTWLPVDGQGRIDLEDLRRNLTRDTSLVSIMHVNNEIGAVNDLARIGQIIQESGSRARFHADLVQSFLKFPLDVRAMNLDYATASAHKAHGPKGIGMLYVRKGLRLTSLIHGGGQEDGQRAGTHNVPYIAGFGKACDLILPHLEENRRQVEALKTSLLGFFREEDPADRFQLNGDEEGFSPYILNVSFRGIRAEILLRLLEEKGICVSTGSACSSKNLKDSHVLTALKLDKEAIKGSIRICFSDTNTMAEIEEAKAGFQYALAFAGRIKS
ncbi:Cysteine desulfurase IscS [anaerobic digester metagenome]